MRQVRDSDQPARRGWDPRRWAVAMVCAAVLALTGAALAATGDVEYGECLTGDATNAPPCVATAGATADGTNSGLASPFRVAVSPDGRSVYVLARGDDAVAHFQRATNGDLEYVGCLSANTAAVGACSLIVGASANGTDSGMNNPNDLAISPDGLSLYVASSGDDAVAHFARDAETGGLIYKGCLTSDSSVPPCAEIAGSTPGGANLSLESLQSVEVSPDGSSVYALSYGAASVTHLSRASDGALTFESCVGADSASPCEKIPGHAANATDTGFASLTHLAISPDGSSAYTADDADESVGIFSLDPTDGSPAFVECLTGETAITNCTPIPGATANGAGTGMRSLVHASVSPDGRSVFVSSDSDEAVTHFDRASNGGLEFAGCISGDTNSTNCTPLPGATPGAADSGLDFTVWAEPSPDGHSVYALGASDDALVTLERDPAARTLTFKRCLSAETESDSPCDLIAGATSMGTGTGFDSARGLAISPDGSSIYAAAFISDSVAAFDREPDTLAPTTEITAGPDAGSTTNSSSLTFEFESTASDLAAIECETAAASAAAFDTCTSPLEITSLADGTHTFSVRATDIQGNIEDPAVSREFTVDTTAPALKILGKKLKVRVKRKKGKQAGTAKARLRCPRSELSGPCRGKLVLKSARKLPKSLLKPGKKGKTRVRYAAKKFRVKPGKKGSVKLKLKGKKLKAALRSKKARKVQLTTRVRDRVDNGATVKRKAKLKIVRK